MREKRILNFYHSWKKSVKSTSIYGWQKKYIKKIFDLLNITCTLVMWKIFYAYSNVESYRLTAYCKEQ